jgi:hypothetical protein
MVAHRPSAVDAADRVVDVTAGDLERVLT